MEPNDEPIERTAATTFSRVARELSHEAFPEMAEALRARLGSILVAWRERSLAAMPHLDRLTLEEFEDTIEPILGAVADAFASADPVALRGVIEAGPQHGIDRFVQRQSVLDLFEEVRILRGVIIVEMAGQMARPLAVAEAATFHAVFDLVVQLGVMALVREQHHERRRSNDTMREVNEKLIVSSVRQGELAEEAEKARDALRRSEAALEEQLAAARELHALTVRMLEEGDGPSLHGRILDAAMAVMRSDMASMHVVDESEGALRLVASRGVDAEFEPLFERIGAVAGTACAVAWRTGQRVVVPDVETCDFIAHGGGGGLEAFRRTGIRAVQSTPLVSRTGGGILGVISTHWRAPHAPPESRLTAMDALTRQTADLLDRRAIQAALLRSEADFRMLADNMSQLAWTCDTLGNVTWYNRRWLDYTGLTFEEMKGWDWSRVQHPDHLERVVAGVRRSAETGEPWEDTFPLRGRDGKYRWFLSRAIPLRDESGRIARWFGTNTDIEDRIALEGRVKEQAGLLAGESKRKDEFLAMLSHEVRNPLAPIVSALHVLRLQERPGGDDALRQRARQIIERQVGNLTRLVDDLLDVSRVVSGRIRLDRRTVDLNDVVRQAVETSATSIEQRRHELVVAACPEPAWCDADPTRMEEVFVNLLNNAAKFTPDGGRIEVRCERVDGPDPAVELSVRDNGTGIDRNILPTVFDLFTQGERSLARSAGGLGIGLSLARRLVVLHGGTIEAWSPPRAGGAGAEFVVRLPAAPAPAPAPPAPAEGRSRRAEGARVLVVDDNVDAATGLALLLQHAGYSVTSAYTGPDGLDAARQWQPDIVLLDIGLPGLDGYEVARRLRRDTALGKTRLIALTGYGQESDVVRSREAGFDAHATKPVDFERLEALMGVRVAGGTG